MASSAADALGGRFLRLSNTIERILHLSHIGTDPFSQFFKRLDRLSQRALGLFQRGAHTLLEILRQILGSLAKFRERCPLLFGNLLSLLFSLAGDLLSGAVMILLKRSGHFSMLEVSMAGGVARNVGQILMAMLVLETWQVVSYLLVL